MYKTNCNRRHSKYSLHWSNLLNIVTLNDEQTLCLSNLDNSLTFFFISA